MRPAMQIDAVQRAPMQSAEEPGVLFLDRCEKRLATEAIRSANGLIDETGTQRPETVKAGLVVRKGSVTDVSDPAKVWVHSEAATPPQTGLTFIDANNTGYTIRSSHLAGDSDDRNHLSVMFVPVAAGKYFLFTAEGPLS
jgi:hypothetical protein